MNEEAETHPAWCPLIGIDRGESGKVRDDQCSQFHNVADGGVGGAITPG